MNGSINQWPLSDRPRERLLAGGAGVLTNSELLAAVLRTGDRSMDAVDLARSLIVRFGGLRGLLDASPEAVAACPGMGPAKTAAVEAVRGLLERYDAQDLESGEVLSGSIATRRYLRARLGRREREVFGGLFLDSRHHLLANEELFYGSVDRAAVYPREVIKCCLKHNASAVILYHNHPSGVAEPSASDIQLTGRILSLLTEVDVRLVDHIIVGGAHQVSFAERGLI